MFYMLINKIKCAVYKKTYQNGYLFNRKELQKYLLFSQGSKLRFPVVANATKKFALATTISQLVDD